MKELPMHRTSNARVQRLILWIPMSAAVAIGGAIPSGQTDCLADEPLEVEVIDRPTVFRSVADIRLAIRDLDRVRRTQVPIVDATAVDGKAFLGLDLDDDPLGPEVKRVVAGRAADLAGVVVGDHLVSIDNADVDTVAEVAVAVDRHPLDRAMLLTFQRNNRLYEKRIWFVAESDQPDGSVRPGLAAARRVAELEREVESLEQQNRTLRDAVMYLLGEVDVEEN